MFAPGLVPTALPTGAAAPTTGARPTDEIVDHYMAVHWDSSDFEAKAQAFGMWPEQVGSELDQWLPVSTSPEVRSGANLLVGLGSGLLDAFFEAFAKSIPGVGAVAQVLWNFRDGWEAVAPLVEHGDIGAAIFTGLRYAMAGLSGAARNIGDLFTAAGDAAHVLAPFTAGLSEAVGAPAAAIAEGCRLASAILDSLVLGLDLGLTAYSVVQANEAEAQGQFARQAFYRGVGRDNAFRSVESLFKVVASWIGVAVGAVVPTGAPTTLGEVALKSGRDFLKSGGRVLGRSGWDTAYNVTHRLRKSGALDGAASEWFEGANNGSVALGFGDVMTRTRDGLFGADYLTRTELQAAGTDASALIGGARQATITRMNGGMDELEAEPPLWTQELVNRFLEGESGVGAYDVLNAATRPSEWVRLQFAGARYLLTASADLGLDGISGLADLAEGALTGIAQPFVDNVNAWIATNKPELDQLVVTLNDRIQQQTLSLESVRTALAEAQGVSAWVQSFADQGGQLEQVIQGMADKVRGMKIDPASIDAPWFVPEASYTWAIDAVNESVEQGAQLIESLKGEARQTLDGAADQLGQWADTKIAFLQQVFAEGGELETMLQEELAKAQQMAAELTQLITQWDGQIPLQFAGAADWLREVAAQARAQTSGAREAEWQTFITTVAQAYVDDWKARHADDVYENYWPSMPPHEISAVEQAITLLSANYQQILAEPTNPHAAEAARRMDELTSAAGAARACYGGQGGRGAGGVVGGRGADRAPGGVAVAAGPDRARAAHTGGARRGGGVLHLRPTPRRRRRGVPLGSGRRHRVGYGGRRRPPVAVGPRLGRGARAVQPAARAAAGGLRRGPPSSHGPGGGGAPDERGGVRRGVRHDGRIRRRGVAKGRGLGGDPRRIGGSVRARDPARCVPRRRRGAGVAEPAPRRSPRPRARDAAAGAALARVRPAPVTRVGRGGPHFRRRRRGGGRGDRGGLAGGGGRGASCGRARRRGGSHRPAAAGAAVPGARRGRPGDGAARRARRRLHGPGGDPRRGPVLSRAGAAGPRHRGSGGRPRPARGPGEHPPGLDDRCVGRGAPA
ncbi:MAG: hypothetical protein ABMA64_37155, partial [Myxococcota bacterium]